MPVSLFLKHCNLARIMGVRSLCAPACAPIALLVCAPLLLQCAESKGLTQAAYGKLPIAFEPNQGQTDPSVQFLAHSGSSNFFFAAQDAVLSLAGCPSPKGVGTQSKLPCARKPDSVRIHLVGAATAIQSRAEKPLPGVVNYFVGASPAKWHTGIPTFGQLRFTDVYPGVDLVYYGTERQLEFDFILAPHADPAKIQFQIEPGRELAIAGNGDLHISTSSGYVAMHAPVIYQENRGRRLPIPGRFVLRPDNRVALSVAPYDHRLPLVIDPIIGYSTYLGGTQGADSIQSLAIDSARNAYVLGITDSTDFPLTAGAYQTTSTGFPDVFVAKVNSTGTALLYATYLGGSGQDYPTGVKIDSSGNAYLVGYTNSPDFPVTPDAYQPASKAASGNNLFIAKLSPTGSALLYSTYFGGSANNDFNASASGMTMDNSGNIYFTGTTTSADFPVTKGAFQVRMPQTTSRPTSAFVTKFNIAANQLVYSTYLGGSVAEEGNAIAIDASGNAYVTGRTDSPNFPISPKAFQQTLPHSIENVFVTKLNATGSDIVFSTFLDGSTAEVSGALAVDKYHNVYIAGFTQSTDFPVTPGAFQTSKSSSYTTPTSFVTKLKYDGTELIYSTFLGGSSSSGINAITLDYLNNVYAAGYTASSGYQVTPDAVQPTFGGNVDAVVSELNSAGSELIFSTYLGGSQFDYAPAIALDSAANIYVGGETSSGDFWTTQNAVQSVNKNGQFGNAFLTKIDFSRTPNIYITADAPAQSFVLRGYQCPTGTFTAPYQGIWSGPCQVFFNDPGYVAPGIRYLNTAWSDGDTNLGKTLTPQPDASLHPYEALFQLQYQLTTAATPPGEGSIYPSDPAGNWFNAGTVVTVSAVPSPGYLFTGYSGALQGYDPVETVTMSKPLSVTANFVPIPSSLDFASVSFKNGPSNARDWTISITNKGPGTAYHAQLAGLMFIQTGGPPCTTLPVRTQPVLPEGIGDHPAGDVLQTDVVLDFSGCPANARFNVTIVEIANDGATVAIAQLANQFQ